MKFLLVTFTALAAAAKVLGLVNTKLIVDLTVVSNTIIKATINNTGDNNIKLLQSGTILSRAPVKKVRVTSSNGHASFQGAWVRVMEEHLDESAFQTVHAGKTIETVFDLAGMFDLSEGGQYAVQAIDSISVAGADSKIMRSIPYSSNILYVDIDGTKAAESRRRMYSFERRTNAYCSGARQDTITNALRRCRELAATAQYEADQGEASRLEEYFKRSDMQTRNIVGKVFREVGSVCSTMSGGYAGLYCNDQYNGCDSGAVALTYPWKSDTVLCDVFFDRIPASSSDCHMGDQGSVLVHEATHLTQVKGTGDYGYGYDSVQKNSAETDLNHADAYTYFAKSFYETCYNDGDSNSYQVYVCKDTYKNGGCIGIRAKFRNCANIPPDFNDRVSSLEGSFNGGCYAFQHANCQGSSFGIARGQQMDELPSGFNDQISSVRCSKDEIQQSASRHRIDNEFDP